MFITILVLQAPLCFSEYPELQIRFNAGEECLFRRSLQKDLRSWNDFYSVLETGKGTGYISMTWRY